MRHPRLVAAAGSTTRRRDRLGLVLGLGWVLLASVVDLVVPVRTFPLTFVLMGPVLAGALSGPAHVAVAGVLATLAAAGLVHAERLTGAEGWTRVLLVLAASVVACLASQVRTAREEALSRAEHTAARSLALQRRLLPHLGCSRSVQVRAFYRPSGGDLVVAGDLIDVVPFEAAGPGAVAFCVGDVTGHDPAAAGLAAGLRTAWRALALSGGDPAGWLTTLDKLVRAEADDDDRFATACVGIVDPDRRTLLIASAGHPRPVLLGERAAVIDVAAGPPLGLPVDAGGWRTDVFALDRHFGVVLYTDGLVEGRRAPGSGHRFGEESLTAWLDSAQPARDIDDAGLQRLVADAEAANGGPLQDDVAVVLLTGSTPARALPVPRSGRSAAAVTPSAPPQVGRLLEQRGGQRVEQRLEQRLEQRVEQQVEQQAEQGSE